MKSKTAETKETENIIGHLQKLEISIESLEKERETWRESQKSGTN